MTSIDRTVRPIAWCDGLHHSLLALLILTRPLIWDGEPGQPAAMAWYVLVALGLLTLGAEIIAGLRPVWRWSTTGILALAVTVLLIPAGLHSPQAFAGMSTLGQLLGHLAFAAYCSQAIFGRERTAIAALLAGLGVESLYALGQHVWVLPDLERQVLDGTLEIGGLAAATVAERLRNGGVYGTFTLSNTLAAYLLMAVPLAAGVVASRSATMVRVTALAVTLAGLATLIFTNSKGAWIAAIIAVAVILIRRGSGWWRIAVPSAVAIGAVVVLVVPLLREHFIASANVRLGYWRAATALVGERPWSGHGLGGYAAEAPRVLAVGSEYSRHVHNEVLEATVAGGILAGIALTGLFLMLVLRRRTEVTVQAPLAPRWLPIVGAAGLLYFHVFGMLLAKGFPGCDGNLDFIFALFFAVVAAGLLLLARRAILPAWAIELALVAVVLHSLQDFDLHAGGVIGVLTIIACMGGSASTLAIGRWTGVVPVLSAVAMAACIVWGSIRTSQLQDAEALIDQVYALQASPGRSDNVEDAARNLRLLLDQPPPNAADLAPKALATLRTQAVDRAWTLIRAVPAPDRLAIDVLDLQPPGRERLPRSTDLVTAFPHSHLARIRLADDLAVASQWPEALAAGREAVRLAPWHLSYRRRLVELMERCAAAQADPALLSEAARERTRIAELQPLVHPDDRLPVEPP